MINNKQLLIYLNKLLASESYQDYGHNGLQIEGCEIITRIVTGVSLTDALIDKAIELNANAIIVHHGIFWQKDSLALTGVKGKRVSKLMHHKINLYAYHLPLDNHEYLGNNANLAKLLNISIKGQTGSQNLLWYGEFAQALPAIELFNLVSSKLNHKGRLFTYDNKALIKKIAWCSGGAQNLFNQAIDLGVDGYLTGEATEYTMSLAVESKVAYFMAGHYASECAGISCLTKHLASHYKLDIQFIDLPNPI